MDKLLENAVPFANSEALAFDMIRQAINELHKTFNVSVLSAWGNESRLDKDIGFIKPIASNNFDSLIYKHLNMEFEDVTNVSFIGEDLELIVNICGLNVLFLHGHTYENDLEKACIKMKAKYASKGVIIDYIISGHIHSPFVSAYFARGGSGTGDNCYNFNALNISGRASQNAFVFKEDGSRYGLMVDLQNSDDIDGYKFCKALESYHTKSEDKCNKEIPILKIVI
jgi:predicted phosphodiesterase